MEIPDKQASSWVPGNLGVWRAASFALMVIVVFQNVWYFPMVSRYGPTQLVLHALLQPLGWAAVLCGHVAGGKQGGRVDLYAPLLVWGLSIFLGVGVSLAY